MPVGSQDSYLVSLNGARYKVVPNSYSYSDLGYFSQPVRSSNPKFKDWVPETVIGFDNLIWGYGDLYNDPTSPNSYYTAAGVDASVQQQVTLAMGTATTFKAAGAAVGEIIRYWPEFKQQLYAVGTANVLVWSPAASPNGWALTPSRAAAGWLGQPAIFSVLGAASTSVVPGGQYLIQPAGNTQQWYDGTVWRSVATAAAHMLTIRNELWKVFYDSNGIWQVAKSSDGVTYGGSLVVGDGTATVNKALNYDNRMYLLTTKGVTTVDSSGTWYDLIPEIGEYGDPGLGVGSNTFHGQAWLPSNYGLLQFTGTSVLNPQTEMSMRSIGPDQQSWSQSDVRGKWNGLAPHVNYLYGTMTSQSGNGYVLKYRDYPGVPPGHGWHPIASMGAIQMGTCKVSALPWYGTSYPILWYSAGPNIYSMRLPSEQDNALIDANVRFLPQGVLDYPIIDDQMPTLTKNWVKMVLDLTAPANTAVTVYSSVDGGSYATIGSVTATMGVFEFDLAEGTNTGSKLQARVVLTASAGAGGFASQSPVLRSLAVHHRIRPDFRRQWTFDVVAQSRAIDGDSRTTADIVTDLQTARRIVGPVVFKDRLGELSLVTVEQLGVRDAGRDPGIGVQMLAHVAIMEYAIQGATTGVALTEVSFTS